MLGYTIVLGLEHFINKIGYQSKSYFDNGIPVKYLVQDPCGYSENTARRYNGNIKIISSNFLIRVFQTLCEFILYKPKLTEIYDTGRLTILYVLIAMIFQCKVILILRGQELLSKDRLRKYGLLFSLKSCDHIIAKELHMLEELNLLGIKKSKITHISNAIIFPEDIKKKNISIDVLYLNAVIRERNVDLLIEAIYLLKQSNLSLKVTITGFTSLDGNDYSRDKEYEIKIIKKIKDMGLDNDIKMYGFIEKPDFFYMKSKIFILPADVIYLNYSLLEAMSYGVAPLVVNGEGAEKIICNGENGYIVNKNVQGIIEGISILLRDDNYIKIGENARMFIKENYTMKNWMEKMIDIRKKLT